jgi:hypothetical protein
MFNKINVFLSKFLPQNNKKKSLYFVRVEVLTGVAMKTVFWNMVSCSVTDLA